MVTFQVFSSFKAPFTSSSRLPQPSSNGKAAKQQQQQPEAALHQTSKESNNDKTEMVALNMILLEPKEADGYLLAGQLYEKQGRLSAARVMYADSLTQVPTTNPRYGELHLALKKLDLKLGSFVHLFGYDVSCIIFRQLSADDLIQCTGVCQAWGHFMLQWPEFWDSLDGVIDRATIDSLLGGKKDRFYMQGTTNDVLFNSMLKFLVASGARNIKEMHFEDMTLTEEHIDLIVKAAKSSSSTVERMTFKNVPLGNPSRVLLDIVAQCPRLKHFSHEVGKRRDDMRLTFLLPVKVEDPPLLDVPYDVYMLTSLDLYVGFSHCGFEPQPVPRLFHQFIKRCPHLERLSINSHDHMDHGKVIRAAVKHCPRLKDLVVWHPNSRIPHTEEVHLAGLETKGLERFIFSYRTNGRKYSASSSDVASVIKKHHKTLSTLYLQFDRKVIDTRFLFLLARYGMPQLRALYLYTEGNCEGRTQYTDTRNPAFSKAITALVSRCPQLRILHVVEDTPYRYYYYHPAKYCAIPVTEHAILAILTHCPLLEVLKIDTKGHNNIIEECLTEARIEELKAIFMTKCTR